QRSTPPPLPARQSPPTPGAGGGGGAEELRLCPAEERRRAGGLPVDRPGGRERRRQRAHRRSELRLPSRGRDHHHVPHGARRRLRGARGRGTRSAEAGAGGGRGERGGATDEASRRDPAHRFLRRAETRGGGGSDRRVT